MFKNIFKIVTCGTFRGRTDSQKKGEDFNDEHIYYRCLMGVRSLPWTRDLNREYNSRMVGTIRGADRQIKPAKTARPGFLIQTKDNKVTAFGHGQCFRIPYKNAIGDIVPENLKSTAVIDFADALFGLKEHWASRVFFEDATPISEIETLDTAAAHPLMQPNLTSYQLYLKQSGENLTHWDKNNATLRGYKLYWHNGNWEWEWKANEAEKDLDAGKPSEKRLTKDLIPLAKGNKFKSKIRFQNLSALVKFFAIFKSFQSRSACNLVKFLLRP